MEVFNMKKQTIRSLTAKGYSQKKIALTLHIRKTKVVAYQRKAKIGKRAKPGGAMEFWKDVKSYKSMFEVSHKEATTDVKYTKKWYHRRMKKDKMKWEVADWIEQYEFEKRLTERKKKLYMVEEHVGKTPE